MLLVTLALKILLSISQNGISPNTSNKQLGNHLNMDIINASTKLEFFVQQTCHRDKQKHSSLFLTRRQ
jgi:hypothetical protein